MARLGGKDRGLFTRRIPYGTIRWGHQSHVNTRSPHQARDPCPRWPSHVGTDFLARIEAFLTLSLPCHNEPPAHRLTVPAHGRP